MRYYFDNIEDPEIPAGFTYVGDNEIYNDTYEFSCVKHNNAWFAVINEEDPEFDDRGDVIYRLDTVWWAKFDMDKFLQDVYNGLDPDDFYIEDYRLYND